MTDVKGFVMILVGVGLLIAVPFWRRWWESRKDARAADFAKDNMFAVFDQDEIAQKK